MQFKFLLFLCATLLYTSVLTGQDELTTKSRKAANKFYNAIELYNFKNDKGALEELKEAVSIDNQFVEAYLFMADIYNGFYEYENEIIVLKKAISISPDFNLTSYFNLGGAYLLTGNYKEASENLIYFLSLDPQEKYISEANKKLDNCDFAISAMENPVEFDPVNLGFKVNTQYNDIMPSLTADEEILVTTVVLPIDPNYEYSDMNSQEDFFISRKINGEWSPSKNMGYPINTPDNEGAQSISADGRTMVFAACEKADGAGSCDIYFSRKTGNEWSNPVNMGPPINTPYWESQPSLSSDGRTIYFVSNRTDGYGKKDIWVSTIDEEGYWKNPVNLGPKINTKDNDASPFMHPDNQTLYFSSDGRIGMGGFDIFLSRKDTTGNFTDPQNLGYPINTYKDEEFMIVNAKGNQAYFSSNRDGSRMKDIFSFNLYEEARPIPVSYVKGHVFDSENQLPVNARFELIDLETSKTIIKSFSGSDGEYLVCLPSNKNYAFNVSKPGYLFHSGNFSLKGIYNATRPYNLDISLKKIEEGKSVILENIFFEVDSYVLMPESKAELVKLIEFLTNNSTLRIEIGGYTDNTGTPEYNDKLSSDRARAVYEYLINEKIESTRLTYKGYGMRKPIDDNNTESGRSKNRRTEFTIID